MFDKLGNLQEVHILNFDNVKVIVLGLADGMQCRSYSGASTSSSVYPICEPPEHCCQLGDMTIY